MADDNTLTSAQQDDLRALSGVIIPPSDEYGVPGADDDKIQTDMLKTLGRDTRDVREALVLLAKLSEGSFAALDPAQRLRTALRLRATGASCVATLTRVVMQCYYRDDRVVRSLGLEARAPFPKGHVLEHGDWSLLDPVRERALGWRKAT
jgi:hypothetical protein